MKQMNIKEVTQYVETNIGIFHEKRIKSLDNLKGCGINVMLFSIISLSLRPKF
jgi:hypothetical protein